MKVNTNLSRNLRNIVEQKGISQAYISKELHAKPTTVNGWFRGANIPRYETLARLARLLGVTTQDLLSDNFDYNSTIERKSREFVKTPVAGSNFVPLPKVDEGGDNDLLLGKTKEFWQVMNEVDKMNRKEQQQVLDFIKIINK